MLDLESLIYIDVLTVKDHFAWRYTKGRDLVAEYLAHLLDDRNRSPSTYSTSANITQLLSYRARLKIHLSKRLPDTYQ
jgi:hypothetical protein